MKNCKNLDLKVLSLEINWLNRFKFNLGSRKFYIKAFLIVK